MTFKEKIKEWFRNKMEENRQRKIIEAEVYEKNKVQLWKEEAEAKLNAKHKAKLQKIKQSSSSSGNSNRSDKLNQLMGGSSSGSSKRSKGKSSKSNSDDWNAFLGQGKN